MEIEILFNKYGQGIISINELLNYFSRLDSNEKRKCLNDLNFMIIQSKVKEDDLLPAIVESKLKPTFTPCVLLRKGYSSNNLQKIINLPDNELDKVFVLLLNLFKISYKRRFEAEKNDPNKWWYWDLSDERNIQLIRRSDK